MNNKVLPKHFHVKLYLLTNEPQWVIDALPERRQVHASLFNPVAEIFVVKYPRYDGTYVYIL